MFTNAPAILTYLKTLIETNVTNPSFNVNLDEPIELVYEDLPSIAIYPIREDFNYDESFSQDKKNLSLRIEIRMKGSPASTIATPIVNQISTLIKADRTFAGLAEYVEIQSLQWANDRSEKGLVCGAALDLQVNYLI
jgi:hypothetical protein